MNYLYRSIIIPMSLFLVFYMLFTGKCPDAFSNMIVFRFCLLSIVLKICEYYRQRFFLDWRNERGLHWRVGLLHLAKWPFMFFAIIEAVLNRQLTYQITSKVKSNNKQYPLFLPNIIIFFITSFACATSFINNYKIYPSLYIIASIFIICSIIFIFSEHLNRPNPYDKLLLK